MVSLQLKLQEILAVSLISALFILQEVINCFDVGLLEGLPRGDYLPNTEQHGFSLWSLCHQLREGSPQCILIVRLLDTECVFVEVEEGPLSDVGVHGMLVLNFQEGQLECELET